MKKVTKILGLIMAVVMMLSLTISAASGKYEIIRHDLNDYSEFVAATINGNYKIGHNKVHDTDEYILEAGASVTIQLPTKAIFVLDDEKNYFDDDVTVYYASAFDGVAVTSDRCTVTNMVKDSNTDGGELQFFYKSGLKVTFNKPGKYTIETYGACEIPTSRDTSLYVPFTVVEKGGIARMEEEERKANTAKYNNAKVLVNGVPTTFEAYNFSGNNYFKLRDLAMAVNGTEKQFEVSWDAISQSITITPNTAYTPVGGELVAGDGTDKVGKPNENPLSYRFYAHYLKAYNINGNNYFKLRDICKLLDIGVTWDGATSTIGIDTTIPYTE